MAELALALPAVLAPARPPSRPVLRHGFLPAARHLCHFASAPLKIAVLPPRLACPLLPRTVCRASTSGARGSSAIGADLNVPALHSLRSCGIDELKEFLFHALEGLDRGIFGVPTSRKVQIEQLIELLEDRNPLPRPTENLDKVNGEWRLLYSTITILGSKRTKLGMRGFVTLGDITQSLDIDQRKAVNIVMFHVAGLVMLSGSFTIESSYDVASPTRVNVHYEKSDVTPEQLLNFFQKNYNVLLSIFNPEGWLEITYVDDSIRIGRDAKGQIFLLGRDEVTI